MIFTKAIYNLIEFGNGFIIGLMLDILATKVYKNYPKKHILIALIIFQLFIMFYIIELLEFGTYSRIGIIASQIVLFDYAIHLLYDPVNELNRI